MRTTSNIKLTVNIQDKNNNLQVKIRLNDECGNGHEDFSITGTIWKVGKARTEGNIISCGAIGDKLAKLDENYALINRLHLCDSNGIPMHAVPNMFYHLKNGFNRIKIDLKTDFCEYYRITSEQYDTLSTATEKDYFVALFTSLPEITKNWKKEANKAIKYLESETGKIFKSEAVKNNLGLPTPEVMDLINENIKKGFYTPEKAKERSLNNEEKRRDDKIRDLKESLNKAIKKETFETEVKILLIEMFGTHDNVIYYSHTHTLVFNYNESRFATYSKKWTSEEVEQFDSKKKFSVPVSIKHTY